MAYGGTVTLHDQNGAAGYTIRYGCMPEGDILGLRDRMVAVVATLRSKRPDLKIELLCDGAPEMWNLLEEGFRPKFCNVSRLFRSMFPRDLPGSFSDVFRCWVTNSSWVGARLG